MHFFTRAHPHSGGHGFSLLFAVLAPITLAHQWHASCKLLREKLFLEHPVMANWQTWKSRIAAALVVGAISSPVLAATPVLSITATPDPAVQGSPLSLDILISGISDLYGYQFSLSFNPSVLQATNVVERPFLSSAGATSFIAGSINNTTGSVGLVADALTGLVQGASGSGVLARINFNVIQAGTSSLTFSNVAFLDSLLNDITLQVNNRSLVATAVPEPAPVALFALGLMGLVALRLRRG
jgi:Cohesin domain/PEP-CTERM motif